jgi:hypothetical protein
VRERSALRTLGGLHVVFHVRWAADVGILVLELNDGSADQWGRTEMLGHIEQSLVHCFGVPVHGEDEAGQIGTSLGEGPIGSAFVHARTAADEMVQSVSWARVRSDCQNSRLSLVSASSPGLSISSRPSIIRQVRCMFVDGLGDELQEGLMQWLLAIEWLHRRENSTAPSLV